ncbi:MAG: hypothetical protein EA366_12280 [Spirulina sp. DLM2.Bin59]|nr:MAG: hypothetical protein EA366_12280 [Spirulina sp. DLM2.Bin59]
MGASGGVIRAAPVEAYPEGQKVVIHDQCTVGLEGYLYALTGKGSGNKLGIFTEDDVQKFGLGWWGDGHGVGGGGGGLPDGIGAIT